jgi:hypothetical protein
VHKNRYDLRREDDGTWTVFDIFTGAPAIAEGEILAGLEMEDADDLVDLLNGIYIKDRGEGE